MFFGMRWPNVKRHGFLIEKFWFDPLNLLSCILLLLFLSLFLLILFFSAVHVITKTFCSIHNLRVYFRVFSDV